MAACRSLLLLIFSNLAIFASSQQILPSQQNMVLRQLRKLLEFPKQLDSWNGSNSLCSSPPSPSLTISCEGGSVTELKIAGDKVTKPAAYDVAGGGAVPEQTLSSSFSVDSFATALSRLPSLKVVILVSMGIWGPLPDKIHRLESLQVLDLSSNFLYGSIPPKLSTLSMLQTLNLDGNFLNGTVPDWLDSPANLTVVRLQNNRLKGPLPPSIGRARALSELSLSGNNISGGIPDLRGLESLEVLDLRGNELDSQLPLLSKSLVTVLLSRNSLAGEIPLRFGEELDRLQHLDLSFNLLEGVLPPNLFALRNILYLNLADNMLSGSLPSSLSCGSQLSFVDVSDNRLSGELPPCLSSNSSKMVVNFSWNCLIADPDHQHDDAYCEESHIETERSKKGSIWLLVLVIGGAALFALLLLLMLLFMHKRKRHRASAEQGLLAKPAADGSASGLSGELLANARCISQSMKLEMQALPAFRVFSLDELKEATRNFDESSYIDADCSNGKLYKGRLENGSYVAIRCIEPLKKYSIRNLKLRLDLLSKLRHPQLVCLLGHCIDGGSPDDPDINRIFLVYEYISNMDLRTHLSDSKLRMALKWPDRLSIVIDVAKALNFLHTGMVPAIVGNELETRSVLLDDHLAAKVFDYGLSIITDEIGRRETKAAGKKFGQNPSSAGEMLRPGVDDIYALGLILLEVLVGATVSLETFLILSSGSQEKCKQILDPIVVSTSSQESLDVAMSIANKCLSPDPSGRPSIEDVLWNLQYSAQVQAAAAADERSEASSQP